MPSFDAALGAEEVGEIAFPAGAAGFAFFNQGGLAVGAEALEEFVIEGLSEGLEQLLGLGFAFGGERGAGHERASVA